MTRIQGISVTLIDRKNVGTDPFGAPLYEDQKIQVHNVLIQPNSTEDMARQLDLTGEKAMYTLAIPKGDTHQWEDRKVEFFGRTWQVVGIPLEGIESMIPLDWNKKVQVKLLDEI